MMDAFIQNNATFVLFVTLWTLPWTGWALWLAARRGDKWWFIILLVVNSLAILEIIYIFLIAKRSDSRQYADNEAHTSETKLDEVPGR